MADAEVNTAPLGLVAEVTLGKMIQSSPVEGAELVPYIKAKNVRPEKVEVDSLGSMYATPAERVALAVRMGDIFVIEGGATAGRAAAVRDSPPEECIFQNAVHRVRAGPRMEQRFLYYVLAAYPQTGWYEAICSAATFKHLTGEKMARLPVPVPPLEVQRRVADMLDTETVRIDTLIEKNERVLELLSQRATALITAAVTGAVDVGQSGGPRTPFGNHVMSSLVTGLSTGLQPIRPMRYLAEVNSQSLPETHPVDAEIEYLDIGAVGHGQILLTPDRMTFGAAPSRARRVVQKGDILVSTVRTYLRAVARIAEPPENLIASTGFAVLRARPDVIEPRFLFYWCLSDHFIESVVSKSTGVSYPAINASDLLAMPVFCPPLDVQRRIADMLDVEIEKMEELRSTVNRQQDLLRLRRQALITAAVTGQIEV